MTLLALLTILAAQPDCRRFEDATHVCTPLWTGGCACASVCREATPRPLATPIATIVGEVRCQHGVPVVHYILDGSLACPEETPTPTPGLLGTGTDGMHYHLYVREPTEGDTARTVVTSMGLPDAPLTPR